MKKFLCVLLSSLMFFSISTLSYAEEPASICSGIVDSVAFSKDTANYGVQPLAVEYLYEYQGNVSFQLSGTFALNARRNLSITFAGTANCTLYVYRGNSLVNTIQLTGDTNVRTYSIKTNASSGNYRFELHTNTYDCFAVISIFSTEYV